MDNIFMLELLLVQCIYGIISQVESMQDKPYSNIPIHYVFTPLDHQRINNLVPADRNPYIFYYSPMANQNYIYNAKKNDRSAVESKLNLKKALFVQPISYAKLNPGYPSLFLTPPSPNSVSNYEKYLSHPVKNLKETNDSPKNHRVELVINENNLKTNQDQGPAYAIIRDHDPNQKTEPEAETTSESKHSNKKKKISNKDKSGTELELSTDGDRVEFQIQGHEGPKTYIFGFDTGDGKNRQFRLEERLKDGTVKGHYGYYDARGKLRTIKYVARPVDGYKEQHHESQNISTDEEG